MTRLPDSFFFYGSAALTSSPTILDHLLYNFTVSDKPYSVHIVVDPSFGDRLMELPNGEPVWVVDSPANAPVVHRIWTERPQPNHLIGLTKFDPAGAETPELVLLNELDMIDLHHGEHSATPPYSVAKVYGTNWTPAVAEAFAAIGFRKLRSVPDGFVAEKERTSI
ncbi:MAG TPA: hypothetical protein VFC46_16375 [Humisphaera sp.]|nr:hypothetical protein [Humisphaera sp.]